MRRLRGRRAAALRGEMQLGRNVQRSAAGSEGRTGPDQAQTLDKPRPAGLNPRPPSFGLSRLVLRFCLVY